MWQTLLVSLGGIVVGDRLHSYLTRTMGEKAQIGDVAFVPMGALNAQGSNEQVADPFKELQAMKNVGVDPFVQLIPVTISHFRATPSRSLGRDARDAFGTISGQLPIPVMFSTYSIRKLQRRGVDIKDGMSRIY